MLVLCHLFLLRSRGLKDQGVEILHPTQVVEKAKKIQGGIHKMPIATHLIKVKGEIERWSDDGLKEYVDEKIVNEIVI